MNGLSPILGQQAQQNQATQGSSTQETAAEILNTIQHVTISVVGHASALAGFAAGSPPKPSNGDSPVPNNICDHLRELRAALNYADSELTRARQALGV